MPQEVPFARLCRDRLSLAWVLLTFGAVFETDVHGQSLVDELLPPPAFSDPNLNPFENTNSRESQRSKKPKRRLDLVSDRQASVTRSESAVESALWWARQGQVAKAAAMHREHLASVIQERGKDHWSVRIDRARQATLDRWASLAPENQAIVLEATECWNAGQRHIQQHELRAAVESLTQAHSLYEQALGGDDFFAVSTLADISEVQVGIEDHESAKATLLKSLEGWYVLLGSDHPCYANALNRLGAIQLSAGDLGDAETLFSRALSIYHRESNDYAIQYATVMSNLASLYNRRSEFENAAYWAERAVPIGEKHVEIPEIQLAAKLQLVCSYMGLGRLTEAETACDQMLDFLSHLRRPDPKVVAQIHMAYAGVLRSLGRDAEAATYEAAMRGVQEKAGRFVSPIHEIRLQR